MKTIPKFIKMTGECGCTSAHVEPAKAKTMIGLKRELTRERCHGDRFARGYEYDATCPDATGEKRLWYWSIGSGEPECKDLPVDFFAN